MKVTRMGYIDDGVAILGLLIERTLRKPVFVSMDPGCGWDRQIITKNERNNLISYSRYQMLKDGII